MTPPTTISMSSRPSSCSAALSCGHERQVAGGQRRHADDVDVGLDGLPGDLLGRLEQRADVDVEAEVGERRGDHLLAAVVAVLAHLGDEDARPAALRLGERARPARAPWRRSGASPTSLRYTPVIVRIAAVCRPNTSSRAALISPTVAWARAASIDSLSRFCVEPGAARAVGRRPGRRGQPRQRVVAGGLVALGPQPLAAWRAAGRARRCCRP